MPLNFRIHTTKDDIKYCYYNEKEYIIEHILKYDSYEYNSTLVARKILQNKTNGVILDIGSNIGTFTIPLAKKFNNLNFICFEPQNFIFLQLASNIFLNEMENCKIYNFGLGDREQIIETPIFDYKNEEDFNFGTFNLSDKLRKLTQSKQNVNKTSKIEIKKLDDLNLNNIELIKIDVEGMEKDVILGAIKTLKNNNYPPIIFECWDRIWFEDSKIKLFKIFENLSYKYIYKIQNELYIASNEIINHENLEIIDFKNYKKTNYMRTNLIVVDDFYTNPDSVRNFALQQDYNIIGNYPGKRTKSFLTQDVKDSIEKIVNIPVTNWNENSYTGCFQIALKDSITWIHTDHHNMWAGIVYLTPNAPIKAGTGLYLHKKTNSMVKHLEEDYSTDTNDYELCDIVGNRYNRLILFRSDMFHDALGYFGETLENGRLFQLFFFDTLY